MDDDDFDVLTDGIVVGRTFKAAASPVGRPWMWMRIFAYHEGPNPHARPRAGICAYQARNPFGR